MRHHQLEVRVYWEDTDAGGLVYHASYLRFLERGRTEFLRNLGVEQSGLLAETGLAFVVRRMEIDFLRPGRLDDLIEVDTRLGGIGGASIALVQVIKRGEEILVEASVSCATVDLASGRAARMPGQLKAIFVG